ncbi:MAG: hypothetical protein ACSHYA_07205 [Opitutaceae bacterium]
MSEHTDNQVVPPSDEPVALAGGYLRAITTALAEFSDFSRFLECLKTLVGEDAYLQGSATLVDSFSGENEFPDFENLAQGETVVAVTSQVGNLGYLKYSGRRDEGLFSASDMHLMGSLAALIGALAREAHTVRQKTKAEGVLKYLVNQLPLGVLCLDGDGHLIVESALGRQLLGDRGLDLVRSALSEKLNPAGSIQIHLEIEGRLVYCEGRVLDIEADSLLYAFVLYDLSEYRVQLIAELEKEAYRCESRGTSVVLALLECDDSPGSAYAYLLKIRKHLKLESMCVQPLDANRSVMVFNNMYVSSVRRILRQISSVDSLDNTRVAIIDYVSDGAVDSPAECWLEQAINGLGPFEVELRPRVIVMDSYPGVLESLQLILSDRCEIVNFVDVDEVEALLKTGRFDGLFFDLDAYSPEELACFKQAVSDLDNEFVFYFGTVKRRTMIDIKYGLSGMDVVFQKPYNNNEVNEAFAF